MSDSFERLEKAYSNLTRIEKYEILDTLLVENEIGLFTTGIVEKVQKKLLPKTVVPGWGRRYSVGVRNTQQVKAYYISVYDQAINTPTPSELYLGQVGVVEIDNEGYEAIAKEFDAKEARLVRSMADELVIRSQTDLCGLALPSLRVIE